MTFIKDILTYFKHCDKHITRSKLQFLSLILGVSILYPIFIFEEFCPMLGIHKSYNSEAAVEYFTNALSTEGYYLDGETEAVWKGEAAKRLGLYNHEVTKENFSALVNNRYPNNPNERITPRDAHNRRAGFDLTFSAPKSISIALALTQDEAILKAHQYAYTKALEAVEADIQFQSNTQEERIYEKADGLIYAAFDHFTSRPCEVEIDGKKQYASDPQLHAHAYIVNIVWSEVRQSFRALEIGNIHKLASFYQEIYHSHFSSELEKAGYQTRRTTERFEIGVPRNVIEKFSNRTHVIEKAAKEKGITDAKEKAELATKTRHSKAKAISEDKLYQIWTDRLTNDEFNHLQGLKGRKFQNLKPLTAKEAVDRAIEHWEERNCAFPEKRVIATALSMSYGSLLPEDIESELKSRPNIIRKDIDTITTMATKEMVYAENYMMNLAIEGKGQSKVAVKDIPTFSHLNKQQNKAFKEMVESSDMLHLFKGGAGVGKTTVLKCLRDFYTKTGQSFFAVTPSSQAAELLREDGFEANTIAALLHNPMAAENIKDGILVVDEASLAGVKTMTQLLELAKEANTKTILAGDHAQHNSVEYGDAFRILLEKAKTRTSTLNEVVRQKPVAYKDAVKALSFGHAHEGFQKLDKMGAIKEIEDHDQRMDKMTSDFIHSKKQGRKAIMVSPTNHEGELLNQMTRTKLREIGILKGKDKSFNTLRNNSLTDAQKKDPVTYESGQVIRFVKAQKGGIKPNDHFEILPIKKPGQLQMKHMQTGEVKPLPYKTPEHYQVYSQSQLNVAVGDTIRLSSNTTTQEGTRIFNGTTHEVKAVTPQGLKLSNGKTLPKGFAHFRHGYCETSHSSQGKTVQDVYISMSDLSFSAASKEQFYVSASRGTHSIAIYTSSKDDLKKAIAKSSERLTANDIAQGQNIQLLTNKQRNHHRSLNEKIREHSWTVQQDRTFKSEISKSKRYGRER